MKNNVTCRHPATSMVLHSPKDLPRTRILQQDTASLLKKFPFYSFGNDRSVTLQCTIFGKLTTQRFRGEDFQSGILLLIIILAACNLASGSWLRARNESHIKLFNLQVKHDIKQLLCHQPEEYCFAQFPARFLSLSAS